MSPFYALEDAIIRACNTKCLLGFQNIPAETYIDDTIPTFTKTAIDAIVRPSFL
eukprot:CAMPEP_0181335082 /NCGR_PEP_ID=MMETSP1101-20121128/26632_1 /TAXON_ID=46948 /ORGANISM="Rhodomonas abbreviata, Strain Caron Lab Isolate" /LENGTH=53 /DNA_ID=CAMNT_0023445159 /DNA_START=98 /DNA_END=255 /DNA_ORIENTATION=-